MDNVDAKRSNVCDSNRFKTTLWSLFTSKRILSLHFTMWAHLIWNRVHTDENVSPCHRRIRRRFGYVTRPTASRGFRTFKDRVENTGPLIGPFTRSLTPLTHLLALHCLLRSLTPELVEKCMIRWLFLLCFSPVLHHSVLPCLWESEW